MFNNNKKSLTTYQVSRYCEVYVSTVANWIKAGKLKAYRTPGGHHRIKRTDLIKFMKEYSMPIPDDLQKGMESRILIIDDDSTLVELITEMLKNINKNFIIVSASTGFEAGKQLMKMLPDIIFLDIYLPGMDGYEVCANTRNDIRTSETKIIAITGDMDDRVKTRIMACGANDIIYKPVTTEELKQKIREILEIE